MEKKLYLASAKVPAHESGTRRAYYVRAWDHGIVGTIELEILEGNLVITVRRDDEKLGPVSTVVV